MDTADLMVALPADLDPEGLRLYPLDPGAWEAYVIALPDTMPDHGSNRIQTNDASYGREEVRLSTADAATRDALTRWISAYFCLEVGDNAPIWGWYPLANTYRLSSWVANPPGVLEWRTVGNRRTSHQAAWGWYHWECPASLWNMSEAMRWIGHEHAGRAALAAVVRHLVAREVPRG